MGIDRLVSPWADPEDDGGGGSGSLRPPTLGRLRRARRLKERLAIAIGAARSATSRSNTSCSTARPASARPRGPHHRQRDGGKLITTSGPASKNGRPDGILTNLRPATSSYVDEIHRTPRTDRGVPLPRDGGLSRRLHPGQGAVCQSDSAAAEALTLRRRHDAGRVCSRRRSEIASGCHSTSTSTPLRRWS